MAGQALSYAQIGLDIRPALINGVAGAVAFRDGQPFSIGAVTVRNGKIVELDFLGDPERLRELDLPARGGRSAAPRRSRARRSATATSGWTSGRH